MSTRGFDPVSTFIELDDTKFSLCPKCEQDNTIFKGIMELVHAIQNQPSKYVSWVKNRGPVRMGFTQNTRCSEQHCPINKIRLFDP